MYPENIVYSIKYTKLSGNYLSVELNVSGISNIRKSPENINISGKCKILINTIIMFPENIYVLYIFPENIDAQLI